MRDLPSFANLFVPITICMPSSFDGSRPNLLLSTIGPQGAGLVDEPKEGEGGQIKPPVFDHWQRRGAAEVIRGRNLS